MSSVKKIDPHSDNAFHSALNIFAVPPTNVSINKSEIREILPLNPVDTSPYEFRIFSDNQWLDLSKTYLYLQLQILKKSSGSTEWEPLGSTDTNVGVKQAVGQAFVKQLKMHVNGAEVYDSTKLYPYLSYIKNELYHSRDVKDTWLSGSGYYRDTQKDNTNSQGFKKRVDIMKNGSVAEFMTRLDFDLANQSLYLLNNLNVVFTIYKNDNNFMVHNLNTAQLVDYEYMIKVHKIRMYVKAVDVQPSLNVNVLEMLQRTSAKYPVRRTEIRSTFLTPGRTDYTYNAFTNVVPRRLIIGMVDNESFNGNVAKDSFNFKPFDVQEVTVHVNGRTFPNNPYRLKWDANDQLTVLRPYMDMQDATMGNANTSNGITQDMYRNGWTFFVVPLTATLDDNDGFELIKNSTTTVQLKFNEPIKEEGGGVQLVIIGEFDQILSIDQNRVVVSDGAV